MSKETEILIARLAADARPVQRLRPPWLRALAWTAVVLPYVGAVVLVHGGLAQPANSGRFLLEQAATVATGIAAAIAAFATTAPGYDRRFLLLPLPPLCLWIASVGYGCLTDWLQFGPDGLAIRPDWDCLLPAIVLGALPAAAKVAMLRKGAPLQPGLTLALGALAVAALASFGLQFFHAADASIMVLVWHLGSTGAVALLAGLSGRRVLAA